MTTKASSLTDIWPIPEEEYFKKDYGIRVSNYLNDTWISPPKSTSPRLLNHWENENILEDNRKNGRGWRKYSVIEIVWIHIVIALREFNYSLNQIRRVKEKLQFGNNRFKQCKMPFLEFFVANLLVKPQPLFLALESNGECFFSYFQEIMPLYASGNAQNLLLINLNQIVNTLFDISGELVPIIPTFSLNNAEMFFLVLLRSGKYRRFEIESRDGAIKMISAEEIIKDEKAYRSLAAEFPYQSITTEIKDGKKRIQKRTVRIKL